MHRSAYADRDYRATRARLRRGGDVCVFCGAPATSIDHQPALALHDHVRGSGCCELHPCCTRCNSRGGQKIATARRRAKAAGRVRVRAATARAAVPSRVW